MFQLEEDFEKFSVTRELVSEPTVEQVATYSVKETPEDHDGVERIVVDDLLTQQQCQDLLELTDVCIHGIHVHQSRIYSETSFSLCISLPCVLFTPSSLSSLCRHVLKVMDTRPKPHIH